jgi:eukaryotic-like serine/threonine-protein kinase
MLKPGDTFERYTIEAAIGQGGMGSVYRAHDVRLGRRVALKLISDGAVGAEAGARLLREARAAAALDHPNAVAIFDVGELDGAPYIVMELVSGSTLRSSISDATVPQPTRIAWLTDAARALAAAHRRGLVHRDIKPENVMVREDGVVKVLDFGIARRSGSGVDPNASTLTSALPTLTIDGIRLGTPVYMAPEQIRGEVLEGGADQFAWGVLAYELLTGKLPWRGASDALAVVASILTDEVDAAVLEKASVPPAVRDVVMRALAKRPEDRFASMDDVVRALDAAAKGEAKEGPRVAPPARAPEPKAERSAEPEKSATMAQRYSTQEVSEVLARAIEQQAVKGGDAKLGFDDLLTAAKEVGVDVETLREASRALRGRKDEQKIEPKDEQKIEMGTIAERDAWIRRQRRAFARHVGVFLIVNAAMLVLGFMVGALPWMLIPGLCWAIGLGIHGLTALTANEDDWAEEQKGLRWWQEGQRRRHEVAMARATDKSTTALLKRSAALGQRIPAVLEPELEKAKLRVAMDTGRERAAEEEAALAEESQVKRKKR